MEKVESGSRLVADAGSTMGEIVSSVQRVTDIIGEISAAAGEQSQGVQQVSDTVGALDQATQQNAALVEQSAAAAESLREQSRQLAELVSTFRLSPAGDGGLAAPSALGAFAPAGAPSQDPALASPQVLAAVAVEQARGRQSEPLVVTSGTRRASRATALSAPNAHSTPAPASPAKTLADADDSWQSF